ncbi:12808_t:CDS:2, partial [Racocetra persica]
SRLDTSTKPVTALTLAKGPVTGSTHLQRAIQASVSFSCLVEL